MSIQSVIQKAEEIGAQVGRAGLHAMLPDDFEFYSCTLELLNYHGEHISSLVFPVMPNNVSITNQPSVNIKKTMGGVVSISNNNFTPGNISISGTFGRKFRLLLQSKPINGKTILSKSNNRSSVLNIGSGFNLLFKNGYGTLKVLEKIVDDSKTLDDGGIPKLLFFYNQAINQNFLVEVVNFTINQSLESNRIWNYTLEMKTLCRAEDVDINQFAINKKQKIKSLVSVAVINTSIAILSKDIVSTLKTTGNKAIQKISDKYVNSIK